MYIQYLGWMDGGNGPRAATDVVIAVSASVVIFSLYLLVFMPGLEPSIISISRHINKMKTIVRT